jgi:putative ABC transport system permease protein
VVGLVVRQGSIPVAIGVITGLAGAVAVGRAMQGLLFKIEATDPATFVVMPVLLVAVALAACVIPARRAVSIDPAEALRTE